jgi:hypothetical protein
MAASASASASPTAGAPASHGSLGRLWAEINDPGPAGDALVFLKRHADGIVPACMGLVFLLVGLGVMVLFFRLFGTSDKRNWLLLLFGAVFAAAGFGVLRMGLRIILRKSGAPRA